MPFASVIIRTEAILRPGVVVGDDVGLLPDRDGGTQRRMPTPVDLTLRFTMVIGDSYGVSCSVTFADPVLSSDRDNRIGAGTPLGS
jgi:hypothetical protein